LIPAAPRAMEKCKSRN